MWLLIWIKQLTECKPRKCFRYGSEDYLISKCPKPPKDNEKVQNKVRFSERNHRASQIKFKNRDNNNDQKIYAYMSRISDNYESPSRDFGDSSQLTNWILDSEATCHMSPKVSDFIPGSLEDTDKHF